MRRNLILVTSILVATVLVNSAALAGSPVSGDPTFDEYVVPADAITTIQSKWVDALLATNLPGSWAPLRVELDDEDLALLGLPERAFFRSHRFPQPTMVSPDGATERVRLPSFAQASGNNGPVRSAGTMGPTVATFAGAGWFGIRPGALLLLIDASTSRISLGWCSMAHVYGSPGSYKISTAGHCGKRNDIATVIAAFGNRAGILNPILLDFGKFTSSTGDAGIGKDWALITVGAAWQSLVTPTMALWGGPRGMYTKTGALASLTFPKNGLVPQVSVNPDPSLAQTIVHYGHGLGAHTLVTDIAVSVFGGTGRAGEAIQWGSNYFLFNGYIAPGDSGSGANTLLGDTTGANMEAAGIITHILVDPLMRMGVGFFAGTRATVVSGTLANGQIVPYPAPVSGAP